MNVTKIVYTICILLDLVAVVAGLSKLKRVLKRYGYASSAKNSAR